MGKNFQGRALEDGKEAGDECREIGWGRGAEAGIGGWIEDTDNCLIKSKEGAGLSMLAGGGSVKEVLTKSAEISSLLPALEKTEGGTEIERERGGMEEVVERKREVKEEINREKTELLCTQVFYSLICK